MSRVVLLLTLVVASCAAQGCGLAQYGPLLVIGPDDHLSPALSQHIEELDINLQKGCQ